MVTTAAAARTAALSFMLCLGACVHSGRAQVQPGPRSGHNLVYDRASGATWLLFGYSGPNLPQRAEVLAWDGARWSVLDRDGPGFRTLAGAAVDDATGRLLVFGGAGPAYQSRYGDTWQWMRSGWTQRVLTGPGPTDHHAVEFDQRRRTLISFGGNDPTGGWRNATWGLDSTGWRVVADSLRSPPPRAHHAMVYDSARGRIVLFGGLARDRAYLDDTWEWDGADWRRIDGPAPPARTRHRMAYDAARRVVVLYGGAGVRPPGQTSGFNVVSDLWEYDGRGWREVVAAPGPGKRQMHAMTYDARRREVLLFGGSDGVADRDDLWAWDGRSWKAK